MLTATLADEDGVPSAVAYQWYSDGQPINSAIADSYRLEASDTGRAVHVQASYTDLRGHAENLRSAPRKRCSPAICKAPCGLKATPSWAKR